jgi:tRNA threonylcarbamoyladenosine biosynthesis protein TsaE
MEKYQCRSEAETIDLGFELGKTLPPNSVLCLFGDLGAGKTTFVKGIVAGACGLAVEDVNSPTFLYLNIYQGVPKTVFHFDLYRLKDSDEFLSMGFDEYFEGGGICCIEWPERIQSLLPESCVKIILKHQKETERLITFL